MARDRSRSPSRGEISNQPGALAADDVRAMLHGALLSQDKDILKAAVLHLKFSSKNLIIPLDDVATILGDAAATCGKEVSTVPCALEFLERHPKYFKQLARTTFDRRRLGDFPKLSQGYDRRGSTHACMKFMLLGAKLVAESRLALEDFVEFVSIVTCKRAYWSNEDYALLTHNYGLGEMRCAFIEAMTMLLTSAAQIAIIDVLVKLQDIDFSAFVHASIYKSLSPDVQILTATFTVQSSGVHVGVVTLSGDVLIKETLGIEATIQELENVLRAKKPQHFLFMSDEGVKLDTNIALKNHERITIRQESARDKMFARMLKQSSLNDFSPEFIEALSPEHARQTCRVIFKLKSSAKSKLLSLTTPEDVGF